MKKITIILFILAVMKLFGQGRKYEGPIDPAGDISMERYGRMNGNRILFYFENTTMMGAKTDQGLISRWPNNYKGTLLVDGMAFWVGAEVYIEQDSIPVTDPDRLQVLQGQGELDTLYFIETSYRRLMDDNKTETVEWGFYPVKGYFNETQDFPAMSNKPNSWPAAWPASGHNTKWPGEWNGRFGRGVKYADLEVYYVVNDAQDLEYIVKRNTDDSLRTETPRYYPRPGVKIGDIDEEVTVQKGLPWGGLGVRVSVRGYQWNNPEARDMIFWEYNFANISDYDLLKVGSGYWFDAGLGNDGGDDLGYFEKDLNLAYTWDIDGVGAGGLTPGTIGYAYLESPGKPYDNKDNDNDGLIDEKRDNQAGKIIGPTDGIADLDDFLEYYNLEKEDLKEHYEGDEDQDWQDGYDANGNGRYAYQDEEGIWHLEEGEYPGDDVGLDGVGPRDNNYKGPDKGECNHKPDFVEGEGCEPNFAWTDVTETDMLGLTDYHIFSHDQYYSWKLFFHNDKYFWEYNTQHSLEGYFGQPEALNQTFSTSTFPLYEGQTERISVAMLMTYESLNSLNDDEHSAPNLFRQKETAQVIYERDYRFAQPPEMPTLKAVPGDGKVFLYWDDVADTRTKEPFLQNENDFEGYKLYRATDKKLSDCELITDTFGNKIARKPIFQCDLDNNIKGVADFGPVNGHLFYLGEDTGIKHHFVDEEVQNGRTYYYALVAYDRGIPDIGDGISPTENNIVVELDESENIQRIGKNVQIVTPHQTAAGYEDPQQEVKMNNSVGSAEISLDFVDPEAIQNGHKYSIKFLVDTLDYSFKPGFLTHPYSVLYTNYGFKIYDETDNKLVYEENPQRSPSENIVYDYINENWMINPDEEITTDVFKGMQLRINMPVKHSGEVLIDSSRTGWVTGAAPLNLRLDSAEVRYFPWEYEIRFLGAEDSFKTKTTSKYYIHDYNNERVPGSEIILDHTFNFYVVTTSFGLKGVSQDTLDMVVWDINKNDIFDNDSDMVIVGWPVQDDSDPETCMWGGTAFTIDFKQNAMTGEWPEKGDIYRLNFERPFFENDSLAFTARKYNAPEKEDINSDMDKIKVVPNPYIATNTMEPAVMNPYLNQERKLMFTHIPADCDINIFTSSGMLVDRIKVRNKPRNGIIHWDLLSKEGLEIAAGMYIYHIKSNSTGKEKTGTFAIIK